MSEVEGVTETMPKGPLEVVTEGVDKASGIEAVLRRTGLA